MKLLARPFICVIPGWPWCSSSNNLARPAAGITTGLPSKTQPHVHLIDLYFVGMGCNFALVVYVHPYDIIVCTFANIGSCLSK